MKHGALTWLNFNESVQIVWNSIEFENPSKKCFSFYYIAQNIDGKRWSGSL